MGLENSYLRRLDAVRAGLSDRGLEALWVEPSVGLFYLTGLEPVSMERAFGLLIPASGEMRMVVPALLADESAHVDEAAHIVWSDDEGPERALKDALKGVSRLCIQGSLPAWALYLLRSVRGDLEVELDPGVVGALREIKDEREINWLRQSGAETDGVVEWIGSLALTEMTERELAGRVQARYLEMGFTPSPEGLIAAGANASMPHYVGGDVKIDPSQPLLLDIGCAVDGYWSDTTRIYFPDDLDSEVAEVYEIVCSAYDAAFATAKPRVPCQEVDAAARRVIDDAGYGDRFIHRTGHGVGLEIHEPPYIRGGNDQPLASGHVFSIEPGIYVPNRFGLRYENLVYLDDDGPVPLNNTPRKHFFAGEATSGGSGYL